MNLNSRHLKALSTRTSAGRVTFCQGLHEYLTTNARTLFYLPGQVQVQLKQKGVSLLQQNDANIARARRGLGIKKEFCFQLKLTNTFVLFANMRRYVILHCKWTLLKMAVQLIVWLTTNQKWKNSIKNLEKSTKMILDFTWQCSFTAEQIKHVIGITVKVLA